MYKLNPYAPTPFCTPSIEVEALYFVKSPTEEYVSIYARYKNNPNWVPLHIGLPAIPSLQQVRDTDRNISLNEGSYEDAHFYLRSAAGDNMNTAYFTNGEGGGIQVGNATGYASLNLQPEGGLLLYRGLEVATKSWVENSNIFAPLSHVGAGGNAHALANNNSAGFMSPADKSKLDGLIQGIITEQDPTVPAYVKAITPADISNWNGKENAVNKSTATTLGTSNVLFPTQNAVKTYVDNSILNNNNDFINKNEKGANNGVATLGNDGKIPNNQLPPLAISETFVVNSQAAMLALSTAQTGDVAVRTDINKSFILTNEQPGVLTSWQELLSPTIENSDQLIEGSVNLFFTNARARQALSAGSGITYNATTGVITNSSPNLPSNLAITAKTGTTYTISNSNGSGVLLPGASTTEAGLMGATDKVKLNSLNNYTLPIATASTLGGVKIGGGINIQPDGTIATINNGTVSSVALTVPAAFQVTGSPITGSGTFTITGAGTTAQYVRGDGSLATFPAAPVVNNATLTLSTSGIASGTQTFTSNDATNKTFTVNVPGTNLSGALTDNTLTITSSTGTGTSFDLSPIIPATPNLNQVVTVGNSMNTHIHRSRISNGTTANPVFEDILTYGAYTPGGTDWRAKIKGFNAYTSTTATGLSFFTYGTGAAEHEALRLSAGGKVMMPNLSASAATRTIISDSNGNLGYVTGAPLTSFTETDPLWTAEKVDYMQNRSTANFENANTDSRGKFLYGADGPTTSANHGIFIPHASSATYGTRLAFRNNTFYFSGRESGVNLPWLRVADRDWVTGLGYTNNTGTVTSVSATIAGAALKVAGSPITTNGTLAFTWEGTTEQYIRGDGSLSAFPAIPIVNNATLTLNTSGIATGSQTFTSNDAANKTFTVNVPGTNLSYNSSNGWGDVSSSTGSSAKLYSLSNIAISDVNLISAVSRGLVAYTTLSAIPNQPIATSGGGIAFRRLENTTSGAFNIWRRNSSNDGLLYFNTGNADGTTFSNWKIIADRDWSNLQNITDVGNTTTNNINLTGGSTGRNLSLTPSSVNLNSTTAGGYVGGMFTNTSDGLTRLAGFGFYNSAETFGFGFLGTGAANQHTDNNLMKWNAAGILIRPGGSEATVLPTEALEVFGNTKISSLAGTGNRMVIANAAGVLSTQTITAGTVNSVAATVAGAALNVAGTPITSSGTLAFTWAGTTAQYVNGAGNLVTFPAIPMVNNATLTLNTSGIATGSQTFTSNDASNKTFTVNVPATNVGGTLTGTNLNLTSSTGTGTSISLAPLIPATPNLQQVTTTGNTTNNTISINRTTATGIPLEIIRTPADANPLQRWSRGNPDNYLDIFSAASASFYPAIKGANTTANSPALTFHGVGKDNYGTFPAFWFTGRNTDGSGLVTGGEIFRIDNFTTKLFSVDFNGATTIHNLAGTGNRMVIANAAGVLSTQTITAGTVNSVAATVAGAALNVAGTPITSSGTLAFTWAGTTAQYVNGAGNLVTFPAIPTVNNATLTLNTSGIATGSQTFTSNDASNKTFTVNVPATNVGGTLTGTNLNLTSSTGTGTSINLAPLIPATPSLQQIMDVASLTDKTYYYRSAHGTSTTPAVNPVILGKNNGFGIDPLFLSGIYHTNSFGSGYSSGWKITTLQGASTQLDALILAPNSQPTFPFLAGVGNRMVITNANGALSTQAITSGTVTSLTIGNGLAGTSPITNTGSITLGTPSNITLSSTNNVTTESHSHAFTPGGTTGQYIRGDGSLADFPAASITNLSNGTTNGQILNSAGTGVTLNGLSHRSITTADANATITEGLLISRTNTATTNLPTAGTGIMMTLQEQNVTSVNRFQFYNFGNSNSDLWFRTGTGTWKMIADKNWASLQNVMSIENITNKEYIFRNNNSGTSTAPAFNNVITAKAINLDERFDFSIQMMNQHTSNYRGGWRFQTRETNTLLHDALTLDYDARATFSSLAGTGTRMVVTNANGRIQAQTITTGTVTSVAASITGTAVNVSGTPITASGTLAFTWAGTAAQYINGAGNLVTFPTIPATPDLQQVTDVAATTTNTISINRTTASGIPLLVTRTNADLLPLQRWSRNNTDAYLDIRSGGSASFYPMLQAFNNTTNAPSMMIEGTGKSTFGTSAAVILRATNEVGSGIITGGDILQVNNFSTKYLSIAHNGITTINNLAGTGNRMVVADALGVLSTQAIAGVYTGSTSITLTGTSFQRAALTGDVTAAANSNATTIANSVVSFAKIQNIPTQTLMGRYAAGTGVTQSITLGTGLTINASGVMAVTFPSSVTNLSLGTATATSRIINNSNGTGVTLPVATTTTAGLLGGADKAKLDNLIGWESATPYAYFGVQDTAGSKGVHTKGGYASKTQTVTTPAANLLEDVEDVIRLDNTNTPMEITLPPAGNFNDRVIRINNYNTANGGVLNLGGDPVYLNNSTPVNILHHNNQFTGITIKSMANRWYIVGTHKF